ncbi:putative integral membrane protein [Babesia bovis T2Bo]|uniref:putative integral membrane protein n=1 Tax=Babesia bovis T2Bo TaxID=484906 RepID=UPI001C349EA4|nr:putative integral membrane protein [Babesia bovis T2Bo]KAG6440142.1 putative integral membrane protein [Babesia bovis T2Bo]
MSPSHAKRGSRLLGITCLSIIASPYIYNYCKQAYWTRRYKKLNMDEIISDRFTWLHHCMLRDEIERTIIKQEQARIKETAA